MKQDANVQDTKRAESAALVSIGTDLLKGVKVVLEASLGRSEIKVEEMLALEKGSVITLETGLADHVDLFLNEALVARGEIVAVGDKYGVRIVEIARPR